MTAAAARRLRGGDVVGGFFEHWRVLNEKFFEGAISKNAYVLYARLMYKVSFKTQDRVVKMPVRSIMGYVGFNSTDVLYSSLNELISAGLIEKFIDDGVNAYRLRVPSNGKDIRNAQRSIGRNPSPQTPYPEHSDTMSVTSGAVAQTAGKKKIGGWRN